MPKHSVTMTGGRLDLGNVQTVPEFRVQTDTAVLGDLRVSKGGAFWRPRGGRDYLFLTWEQLADTFKNHGVAKSVGEYNWAPPPPPNFDEF